MKNSLFLFFLLLHILFTTSLFAQAPNAIPYQAVARNSAGNLIPNQVISLRFTLHDSSASGIIIYQETKNVTTNSLGLFNVNIGQGNTLLGTFQSINWKLNAKFLQVELDTAGGTNYTTMGTTQLLSVPYALYAEKVGTLPPGNNIGDMQYWNGSSWEMIPLGLPGQVLQVAQNNIPKWSGVSFATVSTLSMAYTSYFHTVTINGDVMNDGSNINGSTLVSARGICWDTFPNPTVLNNKTTNGSGLGTFIGSLTNLLPNKLYYARAYAINGAGIVYGNQINFTTQLVLPPTLTTTAATDITGGTAMSGGNITSVGGAVVTVRGVCWSTNPNPTIADNKTADTASLVGGHPTGIFSGFVKHLSKSTTYYIRAYATNESGTGYGNQITITTTTSNVIGGYYLGGIIGYILQPGDPGYSSFIPHGLIAAPNDLNGATWSITNSTNVTSTAIGSGNVNTNTIVSGQGAGNYAAKLCYDLVLNGYSNWYLPSKDELAAITVNYDIVGGFETTMATCGLGCYYYTYYWTSSEHPTDNTQAWRTVFSIVNFGGQVYGAKTAMAHVRPIKSF